MSERFRNGVKKVKPSRNIEDRRGMRGDKAIIYERYGPATLHGEAGMRANGRVYNATSRRGQRNNSTTTWRDEQYGRSRAPRPDDFVVEGRINRRLKTLNRIGVR